MRFLTTACICLILFCEISCSGTEKKSWKINSFDQKRTISINSPEGKTVNNANVYIKGKFSGKIKIQKQEGYPIAEFTEDSIPERLFYDFYGGEFQINLLESNARGNIELTIEIPYSY
jgi:hypothetical protein